MANLIWKWKRLERPAKYDVATEPRQRPDNVKEEIVRQRGFDNIRLQGDVAEFRYRPGACDRDYRGESVGIIRTVRIDRLCACQSTVHQEPEQRRSPSERQLGLHGDVTGLDTDIAASKPDVGAG